jgi:hypothetical protein
MLANHQFDVVGSIAVGRSEYWKWSEADTAYRHDNIMRQTIERRAAEFDLRAEAIAAIES